MPKRRMTAARILQIKQFQLAGVKARGGPGSMKWARSSILFRHGSKQAAKSSIVRLYSPKNIQGVSAIKAHKDYTDFLTGDNLKKARYKRWNRRYIAARKLVLGIE